MKGLAHQVSHLYSQSSHSAYEYYVTQALEQDRSFFQLSSKVGRLDSVEYQTVKDESPVILKMVAKRSYVLRLNSDPASSLSEPEDIQKVELIRVLNFTEGTVQIPGGRLRYRGWNYS